jgi:hypothetical protein
LHVIHEPNKKGQACDFRPHEFSIKSNHYGTMPHFPNYRLGTSPVCDSTLTATVDVVARKQTDLVKIYPNPTSGSYSLDASFEYDEIEVYNSYGVRLISSTSKPDLIGYPTGVYHLIFSKNGSVLHSARICKVE